jgi:AmiR/NasT family two-component response regulator
MTPLRILLGAAGNTDSSALTSQLERLCHTVMATVAPEDLALAAENGRVDLVVLLQGFDDTARLLGRIAGLRAVSDLPMLLVCERADPVLVDGLADWPACGLIYQPVDSRNIYAGIGQVVAEWERFRALERDVLSLRSMVAHMRGAVMHTDDAGRVTEITADALRVLASNRENVIGQTLSTLLGIPEAPAILALRAADPLVAVNGKAARVTIRACDEDDSLGAGWLAVIDPLEGETVGRASASRGESTTYDIDPIPPKTADAAPAGSPEREVEPVMRNLSLSVLAREVASEITSTVSGRSFRVHVEANIRATADDGMLREMLERLFNIARGATYGLPNGQVRFGQRVTRDRVVYYVFDNGRGDDPARQEFLRDRSTPRGYGRIERIVALHGGVAGFKLDEVGRGATIFFTLPDASANQPAQARTASGH